MKKVLIIGGAGFIGSSLANKLSKNFMVYILDVKKNSKINYLEKKIHFIYGDISISDTFKKISLKFEKVFYIASKTSSRISEEQPMKCFETNIQGTLNLFNWAIKFKPKEIIFTSSMSVYGEFAENVSEKNLCKPTSFYGISKLTGEKILLKLKEYNIKVFIFRLFNVYGPGQNFENLVQGMLSIYLAQAYRKNKIEVTGSLKRFRDFVFIDDVVQALTKKYRYRANEDNIYNVGSGEKTYVKDLIKLILTSLKINKKVVVKKSHSGDTWGTFANNKKLLKNGWKIKTTLKKGLIKTIEDLKKIK